jgi:hypothetical protein
VAAAQAGVAISLVVTFADDGRWPLGDVLASRAGTAGLIRLAAALSVAWLWLGVNCLLDDFR